MFTGFTKVPGSGCGLLFKGDLNSDEYFVEVKSSRLPELHLHAEWILKAKAQAKEKVKPKWAVVFGWLERPAKYDGPIRVAICDWHPDALTEGRVINLSKTKTVSLEVMSEIDGKSGVFHVIRCENQFFYMFAFEHFLECINQ